MPARRKAQTVPLEGGTRGLGIVEDRRSLTILRDYNEVKCVRRINQLKQQRMLQNSRLIQFHRKLIHESEKEKQGRTEDALASAGEEGRGKLRK